MLSDCVVWPCTNGKDVYRQQLQMSWGCYYQCCLGHTACGCNHSGKRLALAQREQRADRRAFALPFAICAPYLNVRDLFSVAFSCSALNWSQLTPIHKTYQWSIVHDSLPPLIGVPSPAKRYMWPAPAQIFATSPCLAKALAVTRFNCLWQLTGAIYHIGREGRLFEYELYIDCIKNDSFAKRFLKSYSSLQLHSCSSLRACVVHTVAPADRWRLKLQGGREALPLGPILRSFSDNSQKRSVTSKLQVRPSNLSNCMLGVCWVKILLDLMWIMLAHSCLSW